MATILTTDSDLLDLLTVPFNATTDFTVLADYCARFAETLIETDDPALRLALCGRLHAALALLQPTLHDPIPPHLTESLTVDTLPATPEHFISEPDSLCEYCLALLQLLLERPAEPKMEQTLTGLLCELVWYFTEGLKAPRWLRTADGVKFISEVRMMQQDWHSADIIAVLKKRGTPLAAQRKTHCGSAVNIARNHLAFKVL